MNGLRIKEIFKRKQARKQLKVEALKLRKKGLEANLSLAVDCNTVDVLERMLEQLEGQINEMEDE